MKKGLTLVFCSILLLAGCSENTAKSTASKVSDSTVTTTSSTETTREKNTSTVTQTTATEKQTTSAVSSAVTTTADLKNHPKNAETNAANQEKEPAEPAAETVIENKIPQERINDEGDMILYQTTAKADHKPSSTTTARSNTEENVPVVTEGAIELPFIPAE